MKYDPAPRRRLPVQIVRIGHFERMYDIMGAIVVLQTLGLDGSRPVVDFAGHFNVRYRIQRAIRR